MIKEWCAGAKGLTRTMKRSMSLRRFIRRSLLGLITGHCSFLLFDSLLSAIFLFLVSGFSAIYDPACPCLSYFNWETKITLISLINSLFTNLTFLFILGNWLFFRFLYCSDYKMLCYTQNTGKENVVFIQITKFFCHKHN